MQCLDHVGYQACSALIRMVTKHASLVRWVAKNVICILIQWVVKNVILSDELPGL